jgi:hypothetical protein
LHQLALGTSIAAPNVRASLIDAIPRLIAALRASREEVERLETKASWATGHPGCSGGGW